MSVTLANPAPPRMTKSVARTADDRELIHVDVTSSRRPGAAPTGVRPHYLAAPAPMGAFVDDITPGSPPSGCATRGGNPGPTGAVTR